MVREKKLPDSELTVMLAIWEKGTEKVHTGEILEQLRTAGYEQWKTQTVQTLLIRLTEKGFLRCEKLGRLNFYTPLVPREQYKEMETSTLLHRFYSGSAKKLVAALVDNQKVSQEEMLEIRKMLDKKDVDL